MTPWISYARASSDEQTKSSAQQLEENTRAAGAPPSRAFADDGVPGRTPLEERPALRALLAFLRSHAPRSFDVRIYDCSRLGRFLGAAVEHFQAHAALEAAGARSIIYTHGMIAPAGTVAGDVSLVVLAHQNLDYSKKLSRDVHRGLRDALREGARTGGVPPWGYDLEYRGYDGTPYARVRFTPVEGERRSFTKAVTWLPDGRVERLEAEHRFVAKTRHARSRLVLGDPARVEAVKLIFRRYLDGLGFKQVAEALAAERLPAPDGFGWGGTGVRSILTNPVYTGSSVYGRRSESSYHALEAGGALRELARGDRASKKQWHIADEGRWIVAENAHEAIVSTDTWRQANERRELRGLDLRAVGSRSRAAALERPRVLAGILICPLCGRNYIGCGKRSSRGYETRYYRCSGYERAPRCPAPLVREEVVDRAVLEAVEVLIHADHPERIPAFVREEIAANDAGAEAPLPAGRLAQVERELKAIVEHVAAENLDLFADRIARLRAERDRLRAEEASRGPAAAAIDIEAMVRDAVARARRFRELLAEREKPEAALELRETMARIVARAFPFPKEGYVDIDLRGATSAPAVARARGSHERSAQVGCTDGRGERKYPARPTADSLRWPMDTSRGRRSRRPGGRL